MNGGVSGGASAAPGCAVSVCRGCCCGTASMHPEVDAEAHLELLRRDVGPDGRVRVTDCLDACERSNVVVVQPSRVARARGAGPVWLGGILDEDAVRAVAAWARAGGPGLARLPRRLARHVVSAPGRPGP